MESHNYDEAMRRLNDLKAANRKALSEARDRKESVMSFGGKLGFVANGLGNRAIHGKIIEVIGGMFRK